MTIAAIQVIHPHGGPVWVGFIANVTIRANRDVEQAIRADQHCARRMQTANGQIRNNHLPACYLEVRSQREPANAHLLSNIQRSLVIDQVGRVVQVVYQHPLLRRTAGMMGIKQSYDTVRAAFRYEQRSIRAKGHEARHIQTGLEYADVKPGRQMQSSNTRIDSGAGRNHWSHARDRSRRKYFTPQRIDHSRHHHHYNEQNEQQILPASPFPVRLIVLFSRLLVYHVSLISCSCIFLSGTVTSLFHDEIYSFYYL